MSIFTPILNGHKMGCHGNHGNHAASLNQNGFILRTIFLHLSGPIKQTCIHKNMSVVVITPWDPRLSNDFLPDVLSFH